MTLKNFLINRKTEFERGHSAWLIWPAWFLTQLSVWYALAIPELEKAGIIKEILNPIVTSFFVFGFVISTTYVTTAVFVGKLDYWRGGFKAKSWMEALNNPILMEIIDQNLTILEKMGIPWESKRGLDAEYVKKLALVAKNEFRSE